MISRIFAVFVYEWQSSMTQGRMLMWAGLAGLPPAICLMVHTLKQRIAPEEHLPVQFWEFLFFALTPMLVTMLGSYLWTTPAVSNEIERKSWVYLAVRPYGKTSLLLGKYLAAITWVLSAALVGLFIAVSIPEIESRQQIVWLVARLTLLSCPAYAATYLFIGTLHPKRAMVIAVVYTVVAELLISFVPAIINQLTIQFRLRSLLIAWSSAIGQNRVNELLGAGLIGSVSPTTQVALLLCYIAAMLSLAIFTAHWREYLETGDGES